METSTLLRVYWSPPRVRVLRQPSSVNSHIICKPCYNIVLFYMKFFRAVLNSRFSNQKPECSLGETFLVRFSQRIISLDCLTPWKWDHYVDPKRRYALWRPRKPKISMLTFIAVIALPYTPHLMLYIYIYIYIYVCVCVCVCVCVYIYIYIYIYIFTANVFALFVPLMTSCINVNITLSLLQHSVMLSV